MNEKTQDGPETTATVIPLLLSGGQKLTIYEITNLLGRHIHEVWTAVRAMKKQGLIEDINGRYMITENGVEHLAKFGVSAVLPDDDPDPQKNKLKIKLLGFATLAAAGEWLIVPAVVLLALVLLAFSWAIRAVNHSLALPLSLAGILFLVFMVWYVKRSHHYVTETERLVVFRRGRSIGAKGPGSVLLIPILDYPRLVDMRESSRELKGEICITKDNIMLKTGIVLAWKVDNPATSLLKISDASDTLAHFAIAMLNTILSDYNLEDVLAKRKAIQNLARTKVESYAYERGLNLTSMEIRELHPPDGVLKSIQNKYTASLEKDAAIKKSEAQAESLQKIMHLGAGMSPNAMNLKYLETLEKIGEGSATKYIIPMEFFNLIKEWVQSQTGPQHEPLHGSENTPDDKKPPAELLH